MAWWPFYSDLASIFGGVVTFLAAGNASGGMVLKEVAQQRSSLSNYVMLF